VCRDKVSAYADSGLATNPTRSNMWDQVKNVFSYSDSVRPYSNKDYLPINTALRVKNLNSSHVVLTDILKWLIIFKSNIKDKHVLLYCHIHLK